MKFEYKDAALSCTDDIASGFVPLLVGGDVVILVGDLGAGKTTFVSHCGQALGVEETVTSPTFAIVSQYDVSASNGIDFLVHVDTYRLVGVNELFDLGLETIFRRDALTMIEWGERIEEYVDGPHFRVTLSENDNDTRDFVCELIGVFPEQRERNIETGLIQAGWTAHD